MVQTIIKTRGARMGKFISKSHSVEMQLNDGDLFRLEGDQRHSRILCLEGTLWVTQEGDPNDHILEMGQWFIIYKPGRVIIQGQPEGRFELLPPEPSLN